MLPPVKRAWRWIVDPRQGGLVSTWLSFVVMNVFFVLAVIKESGWYYVVPLIAIGNAVAVVRLRNCLSRHARRVRI